MVGCLCGQLSAGQRFANHTDVRDPWRVCIIERMLIIIETFGYYLFSLGDTMRLLSSLETRVQELSNSGILTRWHEVTQPTFIVLLYRLLQCLDQLKPVAMEKSAISLSQSFQGSVQPRRVWIGIPCESTEETVKERTAHQPGFELI